MRHGTTKEKRAKKKSRQGLPVKKQPEPSMLFIEGSGCNCRLA